jgi:hypothetical protein
MESLGLLDAKAEALGAFVPEALDFSERILFVLALAGLVVGELERPCRA